MSNHINPTGPSSSPDKALGEALAELLDGPPHGKAAAGDPGAARTEGPCPDPGQWIGLITGTARRTDADRLLEHAAGCARCAERLHLLTADVSPEEEAEAAGQAPASKAWQHRLAVELAATPRRGAGRRAPRIYIWAGAAMAASLTIAAVVGVWWQRANTPERLLAEAYTQSRSFDLRMPGAGFAEVAPQTHLRGSDTGRESARLLDARARIERHLESAPHDAHWLQLEARADVLEEKYDAAIDILDRLLAAGPVTSELLVDDAAAYYQRGAATGSENDRATALEYLRHADELAPGDPVVLFNEAVAMEDRGQVMNAVETWNRYLKFERDEKWLAEGRKRLQALEGKLNQLKSHQSRMEDYLKTPEAMRALAANDGDLGKVDEEMSSVLLPRLLEAAFPMPVDRSRGSPCDGKCPAARTLLTALSASLERNHQDPWLTRFLPPFDTPTDPRFTEAALALGRAIEADAQGDYLSARQAALEAAAQFRALDNAPGEERAEVERSYALMRSSDLAGCFRAVHPILGRDPEFAWIRIHILTQDTLCDPAPGTAGENNPGYREAVRLAHESGYALLEIRARNLLGAAAVDGGDSEAAWRIYLPTVRAFYAGDYPPHRLYGTLSGLEQVEESTPRVRHALLLQREVVGVLEMTPGRQLVPTERFKLASAAIRAGSIQEAQEQAKKAQAELESIGGGKSVQGFLAENELALASFYLGRKDMASAARELDAAKGHMAGENNAHHLCSYAVALGQLNLAQGRPQEAERVLTQALRNRERIAGKGGAEGIALAQENRELYAVLAGVWLAEGHPGEDVLALWERYRLRILGMAVSPCADKSFACLRPRLQGVLSALGARVVLGQIVLSDRLLLYQASARGVAWIQFPMRREDVLASVAPLERTASSPATPMGEAEEAGRRAGKMLLGDEDWAKQCHAAGSQLLIEADPILGNLPWPLVETAGGPMGLEFNLEELPSLLLEPVTRATGRPLVVGASIASGENQLLPEVLKEARAVAQFGSGASVLLGEEANGAQVAARLSTASAIHFAGHAAQMDGAMRLLLAPDKTARPGMESHGPAEARPYLDSDLFRKHPPRAARLAVFSACSTGRKEEAWNHGMGDIVDALAALGVPDVVATRWQIDSFSAVPMMDAFYDGLAKGESVPQALTGARRSLIRDARYRHPYYWAGYYASGRGGSDLSRIFHSAR